MEEWSAGGYGVAEDQTGVLSKVLTRKNLGEGQRYDKSLKYLREKAGKAGEPYFWKRGGGGIIDEGTLPVPGKEFANLTGDSPRESTCHGS